MTGFFVFRSRRLKMKGFFEEPSQNSPRSPSSIFEIEENLPQPLIFGPRMRSKIVIGPVVIVMPEGESCCPLKMQLDDH